MTLPKSQSEAMQIPSEEFLTQTTPVFLAQLTPDTARHWGKMTPQHMVEHVSSIFYISRKDLGLPSFVAPDKQEKAQAFIWREDKMLRQGTKAPMLGDKLQDLKFDNLDAAKKVFLESIEKFYAFHRDESHAEPPKIMHPAFGLLDLKAWERFHHKHIIHHFAQFGLMETDM
ncbi:MAG: DUF1569 domain-containing protein, partial [Bacteroidota bacterium]